MLIYIVTQGEYSDYHIEKVFEDKEKAQEYCDFHIKYFDWREEEYAIEIYDTNDLFLQEVFIEALFKKDMCRDINLRAYKQYSLPFEKSCFYPEGYYDIKCKFSMISRSSETKEQLKERAKKIAIDKYFQWKSEAKQCE